MDGFCLAVSHVGGRGAVMDFQRRRLIAMTHLGERVYTRRNFPTFNPRCSVGDAARSCSGFRPRLRWQQAAPHVECADPASAAETFEFRHNTQYCEVFAREAPIPS